MTLTLLIIAFLGAFIGGLAGGALASRYLRRADRNEPAGPEPPDEWTAAEIDRAAADWAAANGRGREAAGMMADKLNLLDHLGQRRGWWS
jgi:hypothetical protein